MFEDLHPEQVQNYVLPLDVSSHDATNTVVVYVVSNTELGPQ